MTEQDRGAYTPQTDAPLAFDARYSRGSGERPIPMTLIISGVVLITLVAALAFFYRGGARGPSQAPAVIGTPVADTKAPPSIQPDATDSAAGMHVYKAEAVPAHEGQAAATAAVLAPAPETVGPRPVAAAPIDDVKLRPAQADSNAQTMAPPAAPVSAVAAKVPAKPVKLAAKPAAPSDVTALATPAAAKPLKAAKTTTSTPKPDIAEIAAGEPVAQIGAFSSSALAEKGWSDVATMMPGQMAGKSRKIEMANVNGKTFYRGFVGGFSSKAAADSFCASLKAAGKGCIVK